MWRIVQGRARTSDHLTAVHAALPAQSFFRSCASRAVGGRSGLSVVVKRVHVANISHKTTEKEIRDFFSFCGKISDLSVTPSASTPDAVLSATITFEQPSAARTALLLDNTQLSGTPIHVSAAASLDDLTHDAEGATTTGDASLPSQEDKPRTAILAEYLAHGYTLGDKILQRGIEFDEKNGISSRFKKFLADLDSRHKVSDKSRAMDTTYGISDRATQGYNTVARYLDNALTTPTGQKVHTFYQSTKKEVLDIHNEAVRLKNMNQGQREKCTCENTAQDGTCTCAPGSCACDGCKKNVAADKAAEAGYTQTEAPAASSSATGPTEKVVSATLHTN
ncbi:hypothetical protein Dda_2070 [Drechslerella dactyloides]|uniref:RRM domain-containing protein n=1 Tax=Drechslerella dactyloides TaxID=74499 RepID=A0AAD6J709_DREDA|nr:hypothetical protein Dda_2070 [Drechslerella dactyloides]